jgi:hypothetical protein
MKHTKDLGYDTWYIHEIRLEISCRKHLRLSKYTDMTIHWKALEEHFLMVPLFLFGNAFSELKTPVL